MGRGAAGGPAGGDSPDHVARKPDVLTGLLLAPRECAMLLGSTTGLPECSGKATWEAEQLRRSPSRGGLRSAA